MLKKILILILMINFAVPVTAKEKRIRDKGYIVASTLLTTGSILLLCVNPIIGGAFLVAGGSVHLVKAIRGTKEKDEPSVNNDAD